jgi:hypothetical protein
LLLLNWLGLDISKQFLAEKSWRGIHPYQPCGVQPVLCEPGAVFQNETQHVERRLPLFSHLVPLVWLGLPRTVPAKVMTLTRDRDRESGACGS